MAEIRPEKNKKEVQLFKFNTQPLAIKKILNYPFLDYFLRVIYFTE